MFRSASSADYIARSAKVVTLVDLAGHERYFKTTAYGLTGHLPDYACLIVSANNGESPSGLLSGVAPTDPCRNKMQMLCSWLSLRQPLQHPMLGAGIVGMCKEHLGVALALKVPVFFVVTKVDICPEHILKETLSKLHAILKKPGVKKKPFMVSVGLLCAADGSLCLRD